MREKEEAAIRLLDSIAALFDTAFTKGKSSPEEAKVWDTIRQSIMLRRDNLLTYPIEAVTEATNRAVADADKIFRDAIVAKIMAASEAKQ